MEGKGQYEDQDSSLLDQPIQSEVSASKLGEEKLSTNKNKPNPRAFVWRTAFMPAKYLPKTKEAEEMTSPNLLELPWEILEKIVWNLDGHSATHFAQSSKTCENIIDAILGGHTKLGLKFWEKQCFEEIPTQLLADVVGSYFNIVEENIRLPSHVEGGLSMTNSRMQYTFEDVYRNVFNLLPVLKYYDMEVQPLTESETRVKFQMWFGYGEELFHNETRKCVTSTKGTIMYNLICPSPRPRLEPNCLRVLENMTTGRRECFSPVQGDDVLLNHFFMTIPLKKSAGHKVPETLPKIWNIFVGVCKESIYLCCLHEGRDLRIPTDFLPQFQSCPLLRMASPAAALDDFLGVWANPFSYRLYQVEVNPENGDISANLIHDLRPPRIFRAWGAVLSTPNHYLSHLHYAKDSVSQTVSNVPTFSMISATYGTYTFQFEPEIRVLHLYSVDAHSWLPSQQTNLTSLIGSAKGHGMYLFWNRDTIAIGSHLRIWHFRRWLSMDIHDSVITAEVIAPQYLMLSNFKEILIVKVCNINRSNHQGFGIQGKYVTHMNLEIIRRINTEMLTTLTDKKYVSHVHFDYDKGHPYIFFTLSPDYTPNHHPAYYVCMKKIVFKAPKVLEPPEERDIPYLPLSFYTRPKNQRLTELLRAFRALPI